MNDTLSYLTLGYISIETYILLTFLLNKVLLLLNFIVTILICSTCETKREKYQCDSFLKIKPNGHITTTTTTPKILEYN